ncbi:hypothetical protein ABKN59_011763 [Abortiporus biennis]
MFHIRIFRLFDSQLAESVRLSLRTFLHTWLHSLAGFSLSFHSGDFGLSLPQLLEHTAFIFRHFLHENRPPSSSTPPSFSTHPSRFNSAAPRVLGDSSPSCRPSSRVTEKLDILLGHMHSVANSRDNARFYSTLSQLLSSSNYPRFHFRQRSHIILRLFLDFPILRHEQIFSNVCNDSLTLSSSCFILHNPRHILNDQACYTRLDTSLAGFATVID